MRIAVAGATGFIGKRLCPTLIDDGHEVRALTRRPESYVGVGSAVAADVSQPDTLLGALAGCDVAYYLVHSLDRRDFVDRDAAAARSFGEAAAIAGVRRIVYLGALGDPNDRLSAHLRSRQQVEQLLAAGGVPVTTVRAGIIIGDGGTSWELLHKMVERVPVLIVPTWARTRTQPIAVDDVIRYLTGVLKVADAKSHTFEIGGADVLRYTDLLSRLSAIEGRPSIVVPVPVPNARLAGLVSRRVLPLVTGVDGRTLHALVQSMSNEVVVRDDSIRRLVEFEPAGYDDAVLAALGERARRDRARRDRDIRNRAERAA
jgi:uncharacterized protein YbjT (DUF2867 family)